MDAEKLSVDTGASAMDMAEAIFGGGASVMGASYTGWKHASGIYEGGDDVSDVLTPSDTGVILSTGAARDVTNKNGLANQKTNLSKNTPGPSDDPQFNDLVGTDTFDASILTVDFVPDGDTLSIQFVYASEEYPEFSSSIYNDAVGVWINGAPVEIAVGTGNTNIGNINQDQNSNLFKDNSDSDYNTEMDGFTVTLTLTLKVNPDVVNTLRIGIADVSDSSHDSNLLIAAESIQSDVLLEDDLFEVAAGSTQILDVLGNDTGGVLTITQINGIDVEAGDTIELGTGEFVTLNSDGTFTLLDDGDEESTVFTYTAENASGVDDVAFVTVNSTVPCFVAGTLIDTEAGPKPVESLKAGDMVQTVDNGFQPLRWSGRRQVECTPDSAPVLVARNALGHEHGPIRLSPLHQVLLGDDRTMMLFGQKEVLVAIKHLVDGRSIRVDHSRSKVSYHHLLFDEHQLISSEGLVSESFFPGPETLGSFDQDSINEICTLFPQIDSVSGLGYGTAARTSLKGYETQLLRLHDDAA